MPGPSGPGTVVPTHVLTCRRWSFRPSRDSGHHAHASTRAGTARAFLTPVWRVTSAPVLTQPVPIVAFEGLSHDRAGLCARIGPREPHRADKPDRIVVRDLPRHDRAGLCRSSSLPRAWRPSESSATSRNSARRIERQYRPVGNQNAEFPDNRVRRRAQPCADGLAASGRLPRDWTAVAVCSVIDAADVPGKSVAKSSRRMQARARLCGQVSSISLSVDSDSPRLGVGVAERVIIRRGLSFRPSRDNGHRAHAGTRARTAGRSRPSPTRRVGSVRRR